MPAGPWSAAMFRYAWKTGRPPAELVVEAYADAYAAPGRVRAMVGYYRAAVRRSGETDRRGRLGGAVGPGRAQPRGLGDRRPADAAAGR